MTGFELSFLKNVLGNIQGQAANPAMIFNSVVTDSRKTNASTLFFALKGEKHDAHDFIDQVVKNKCGAVVCRKDFDFSKWKNSQTLFILVEDTEIAFRKLAHEWRKKFSIPVICVAGSVGKTTSKELLFAALNGKYEHVLKTEGSQNGFVGIPMTLLELRPKHQVAVIEVGIDECGAMKKHLDLVFPTAALLTTIGPEHLEKLKDLETVALEESLALTQTSESGGIVAVNLSDPFISKHCSQIDSSKAVFFEMEKTSSRQALVQGNYLEPNFLEITSPFAKKFTLQNPLLGKHNALNLLGIVALCLKMELSPEQIIKGLSHFKQAFGRSEIQTLPNGMSVICDYYNANPTSMVAGLQLLSSVAKGRKTFACLADMRELGEDEERFHRELSDEIIKLKINYIYLFGDKMKWLFEELKKKRFSGKVEHFKAQAEISDQLKKSITSQDVLLIKGSRGMKMEEVFKQFTSSL